MPHWKIPDADDYRRLNGLDPDVCATCGGLGEVLTQRGYRPCPAQDCEAGQRHREALVARMTRLAHVPARYAQANLQDFDLVADAKRGKVTAYRVCTLFAQHIQVDPHQVKQNWPGADGPYNWLMLQGPVGTGKTHAACAVINYINREHGRPARYVRLDDLLREVRDGYERDAERSSSQVIHHYQDFPILLIDEMNMDRISDHTLEIVESVIRYRYMHDLPTLFTANVDPDAFREMWGERVASVVRDKALWVRMAGANLRGASFVMDDDDE
jgi:DNA replication protein DnaC